MNTFQEEQYARWMAAMRLASKGRSLADSSYDSEVKSILAFLSMQHPAPAPVLNPESLDIQPEHYLSPRYTRRIRGKVWLCVLLLVFNDLCCVVRVWTFSWSIIYPQVIPNMLGTRYGVLVWFVLRGWVVMILYCDVL